MTVLKETVVAVLGVYALLFACDTLFTPARFDDALFDRSFYAPKPQEFRFAEDTPPAVRVRDAFAQFSPGVARPTQRYSSLTTIIR